jgi:ABC-2 type transport system permease protein
MSTTTATPTRSSGANAAVLRTEATLFGRELGSLFWILLFPTILLVVIGLVPTFRTPEESLGGQRVIDLYASVCVILAMIMAAIMAMPPVVAGYRESGILRRLRTTPMHPGAILGAQVVLHAAAVLASVVIALATARVAYGVQLPGSLGWYALSVVLASAAAFSIGAMITSVSANTRVVQTIGTIVFFPMMFTSGVWLPVQTMEGWLRQVVTATPLGAAAEALNDSLQGIRPEIIDLVVMGGWTVVLSFVAIRLFRWE